MAWEELSRDADRENARRRDKLIGVYIGILAVVLAVCSLGGSNADQDATQQSIAASNAWAFFQAKNDRRQALRLHADEFEVMLKATPAMPDDVKLIEAKIADYKNQDKKLTSDAERGEGLDELFAKGQAPRSAARRSLRRGPTSAMVRSRSAGIVRSFRVTCFLSSASCWAASAWLQRSADLRLHFRCRSPVDGDHFTSNVTTFVAITPFSRTSSTRPS